MSSRLVEIFEDEKLIVKIKKRLPYLFQIAELESSRARRIRDGSWFSQGKNNSVFAYL